MGESKWKGTPRQEPMEPTNGASDESPLKGTDTLTLVKPGEKVVALPAPKNEGPLVIPIPPVLLTELRRVDAEIETRVQLRQGLWNGCALMAGIDIVKNFASFDHAAGTITVQPISTGG